MSFSFNFYALFYYCNCIPPAIDYGSNFRRRIASNRYVGSFSSWINSPSINNCSYTQFCILEVRSCENLSQVQPSQYPVRSRSRSHKYLWFKMKIPKFFYSYSISIPHSYIKNDCWSIQSLAILYKYFMFVQKFYRLLLMKFHVITRLKLKYWKQFNLRRCVLSK